MFSSVRHFIISVLVFQKVNLLEEERESLISKLIDLERQVAREKIAKEDFQAKWKVDLFSIKIVIIQITEVIEIVFSFMYMFLLFLIF